MGEPVRVAMRLGEPAMQAFGESLPFSGLSFHISKVGNYARWPQGWDTGVVESWVLQASGNACFSPTLSLKLPEDQPYLPLKGAGLASSTGPVVTPFDGDSHPHTDTSCGVLWFFRDTWAFRKYPLGPTSPSPAALCPHLLGLLGGGAPFLVPKLWPPCPSSSLEASVQDSQTPETQAELSR